MGRTLRRKGPGSPSPAQDYDELEQRLARRGEESSLSRLTKSTLEREWQQWEAYCREREFGDPVQALRELRNAAWPVYLDWRCANSPFQGHCTTTVNAWYKRLCGNYLIKVSPGGAPSGAGRHVRNALTDGGWLVRKYELNCDGVDKDVMELDAFVQAIDVLFRAPTSTLFFRRETQRAGVWRYSLFVAGSGMRPGSYVDNGASRPLAEPTPADEVDEFACLESLDDLPRFKHATLTQFPAADGGPYGEWVLELELRRVKGGHYIGNRPVTYLYHEHPCLALCPIMAFLQMAFGEGAFEAEGLTPTTFFKLQVPPGAPCLPVTFKPSILERPLFADDTGEVIKYDILRKWMFRLGMAAGFDGPLKPYTLRRGVANAIHGNTTASLQNQALNQSHIRVFEKYYQNRRLQVDVQNAFLGIPSNDRLLKLASGMSRSRDPRRPTKITDEDRRQVEQSEEVGALLKARTEAAQQCRTKFGTIKKAKAMESIEYRDYWSVWRRLDNARYRLAREALQDRRTRHNREVAVGDVRQQLSGSLPMISSPATNAEVPPTSLRGRVVAKLFEPEPPMPGSSEDIARRASALVDLVELYTLEEPHHLRNLPLWPVVCGNAACATATAARWLRLNGVFVCEPCYTYQRRHQRSRPAALAAEHGERPRRARDQLRKCSHEACRTPGAPARYFTGTGSDHICANCYIRARHRRAKQQTTQQDVTRPASRRILRGQLQPTDLGLDAQLELIPSRGSPISKVLTTIPQESWQEVQPWLDDTSCSDTPLALLERSVGVSPDSYLPPDDLNPVKTAGDALCDGLELFQTAAGDLLDEPDPSKTTSDNQPDLFDQFKLPRVTNDADADYRVDDGTVERSGTTATVPPYRYWDDRCGDGVETWLSPARLAASACLFCYFDPKLGEDRQSISVFTARSSMQRHAENTHFREMRARRSWVCPDRACCGRRFENENHLKNHAATEHLVVFAATATVPDQLGA